MGKNKYEPLKNKKWLFPETGKAGFHYQDVSQAVNGLKKDLKKAYTRMHEEELINWVEKWFPDVIDKKPTKLESDKIEPQIINLTPDTQQKIVTFG